MERASPTRDGSRTVAREPPGDLLPHPYQSLDEAGTILRVNEAWLDALGDERAAVEGRWFGDFLAPDARERFESRVPEFVDAGEMSGVELELVAADGQRVAVSFDGRVEYDADGEFRRTHCQFTDVTERRAREADIEPLYHGNGLGLWLVNLIVRQSDGVLEFAQNTPRGSVVTVWLSAASAPD